MILLKVTLTCVAVMCLWEKHKVQSYSVLRDAIDLTYDTKDGITVSHPASTKYQMTILLRGMYTKVLWWWWCLSKWYEGYHIYSTMTCSPKWLCFYSFKGSSNQAFMLRTMTSLKVSILGHTWMPLPTSVKAAGELQIFHFKDWLENWC